MTDARWPRVKALFQSALDRDAAERSAFVRDASGGDAALQADVESLLSAHARAGSFAAAPALAATASGSGIRPGQVLHTGEMFAAVAAGAERGERDADSRHRGRRCAAW